MQVAQLHRATELLPVAFLKCDLVEKPGQGGGIPLAKTEIQYMGIPS